MPTLKIMSWNIENLGPTKEKNNSILECIAQTVVANDIDIFIIVELRSFTVIKKLSEMMNTASCVGQPPPCKTYKGFFHSPKSFTKAFYADTTESHYEYFGFIVKDASTVRPYGFNGPWKAPLYFIDRLVLGPSLLTLTTGYDGLTEAFSNSFFLYNQRFPAGRSPCWAQFQQGTLELNIVSVHLRPELKTAVAQIANLLDFDLVTNLNRTLIITGDFNTLSDQNLSRTDVDNLNQAIKGKLEKFNCFASFNRGTPTHVSGEVYDNFFSRQKGNTIGTPQIVPIADVLNILYLIPNAQADLLRYIAKFKSVATVTGYINKMFGSGVNSLTQDEKTGVFRIISDHLPITIQVTY